MIVNSNKGNSIIQKSLQQTSPSFQPSKNNSTTQPVVQAEEYDDDLMKEGYLPEIYFSLKSDNPADW